MAYNVFDKSKPDGASQNGTQAMQSIRDNFAAIRDGVILGAYPGWNFSTSGGTAEQPAIIYYKKSTDWLKVTLTWGTTGGEDGNVTVAVYSFSSDSGSNWDVIGTETITWDVNGLVTATTWS